jgi:predicted dehydrogenase
MQKPIQFAMVGLGFGAEFVPIYRDHPDVAAVSIVDKDGQRLQQVGERFNIQRRFSDFEEILRAGDIDAVHLVSGIPDHAPQALAALRAGKHVACTVPMATHLDDLRAIVRAQKLSGKNYMSMETAVYTRQFLYAQELKAQGAFGRIQFLRGAHTQDMERWPYDNPFPVETAIFQLAEPGLAAEVTRTLFHCARPYMESFVVYGENACYEWQMEDQHPLLFRMSPVIPDQIRQVTLDQPAPPDRADRLPPEIARYTRRFVYNDQQRHLSFDQGGGHHGSHPHLVHEFVRSIIEERSPWINAERAADWSAAGICAHQSAMQGGSEIVIPSFED